MRQRQNKNKSQNKNEKDTHIFNNNQSTQINNQPNTYPEFITDFQYECKKILHLWLANIISGSDQSGIKYDFRNKTIIGRQQACLAKLQQCDQFLQTRKMSIVFDFTLDYNSKKYLILKLDAKIYEKQQVQKAYTILIKQYKLKELKQVVVNKLEKKNYFLISIDIQEQQELSNAMELAKQQITRKHIKQAQQYRDKKNAQKQKQKQQKQQRQKQKLKQQQLQKQQKKQQKKKKKYTQKKRQIQKYLINLDLKILQLYFEDQRVITLIIQTIAQIVQKYQFLKLIDIQCTVGKFIVLAQMLEYYKEEFMGKCKVEIQEKVCNKIRCQQIIDQNQLTPQLSQNHILLPSKQNPTKIVLIQLNDKIASLTTKILQITYKQAMINTQIKTKNYIINYLPQCIQNIKCDPSNDNDFLNNCKICYNVENCRIQVFGHKKYVELTTKLINRSIGKLEMQIFQKKMVITSQQAEIVQKHITQFQKIIYNSEKLIFSLQKNSNIDALITLGPSRQANLNQNITIQIYKNKKIQTLPRYTTITLFSKQQLNNLSQQIFSNQLQILTQNNKNFAINKTKMYKFIKNQRCNQLKSKIQYTIKNSIDLQTTTITTIQHNNYAFFLPKIQKLQFLQKILNTFYNHSKTLTFTKNQKHNIYIFDNTSQQTQQYQKLTQLNYPKIKTQYGFDSFGFTSYSDQANQKIVKALKQKQNKIYLINQDKNTSDNYLCSFKQEKIKHIKNKNQIPINIYIDRITFNMNGNQFLLPNQQIRKVEKSKKHDGWVPISLNITQLDLNKYVQTDIFTGLTKKIKFKEYLVRPYSKEWQVNISLNYKVNYINIFYIQNQQTKVDKACKLLKQLIKAQKITIVYNSKYLLKQDIIIKIKQLAKDHKIEIQWNGKFSIKIIGQDKMLVQFIIKRVDELVNSDQVTQVKFPLYWEHQNTQIQIFTVPPTSTQFKLIQNSFAISPIKKLIRIQNKILFQKYQKQKAALTSLNEGKKVHTMMLYHGTSKTDPKFIYEDKQQSFNINYTSQRNFLGKGTYFAQKARYSNTYAFHQFEGDELISSMFYCEVLVGQPQQVLAHNQLTKTMVDTDFKDKLKKIRYQSATLFTNNSQIYAVYKNRRAYPHYLIKY